MLLLDLLLGILKNVYKNINLRYVCMSVCLYGLLAIRMVRKEKTTLTFKLVEWSYVCFT